MSSLRILIVDDDHDKALEYAALALRRAENARFASAIQTEVAIALSAAEAKDRLRAARREGRAFDVAVIDLFMPSEDGLALIRGLRNLDFKEDALEIIVVSQQDDAESHSSAINSIEHSWGRRIFRAFRRTHDDVNEFLDRIAERLESKLDELRRAAVRPLDDAPWEFQFITADPKLKPQIETLLTKYAPSDCSILLVGENGTGKGRLAHDIHERSRRRNAPLVTIDVTTLQETLIESELFGHVKGAFTNATRPSLGRIRAADGGTIFLDEIDKLPRPLQGKFLRAIEERVVMPVGSQQEHKVDFRLIAATQRDLKPDLGTHFEEALYYRINVMELVIPPLRERRADIVPIAMAMWEHLDPPRSSDDWAPDALQWLTAQTWKGNARNVRNFVMRTSIAFPTGTITRARLEQMQRDFPHDSEAFDGLSNVEGYTQRKYHTLFYPAMLEARGDAKAARMKSIDQIVFARDGFIFDEDPDVAMTRIHQAFKDHLRPGNCAACKERWAELWHGRSDSAEE